MQLAYEGKTLVWAENQLEMYSSHINVMRGLGIQVFPAETCKEAIELIKKEKPDACLTDLLIPDGIGIDIIESTSRILPECTQNVLSNYTDIRELRVGLKELGHNVSVTPKPLPGANSKAFKEKFLSTLFRQQSNDQDIHDVFTLTEPEIFAYEMSFKRFMDKPFEEKAILAMKVKEEAKDALDHSFETGNLWALICGDSDEPIMVAESMSEVPMAEEILRIAKKLDRAPFQFTAPLEFDDYQTKWSISCSTSLGTRDYPTVTLKSSGKEKTLHFDTGSPFTVLDDRLIDSEKWIDDCGLILMLGTTKGDYVGRQVEQKVLMIDQATGSDESKQVLLKACAIPNWNDSGFFRECKKDCMHNNDKSHGCKYRNGLIGRTLMIDNNLSIILDGKNRCTSFYPD